MNIDVQIWQGHEPALSEAAAFVVIDVIRAFSTTQIAFEQGASHIFLARRVEDARALKLQHPLDVLAGERKALKIEGFDLGNSPFWCAQMDLSGRGMILTTTNGVRATLHAMQFAPAEQAAVFVSGFGSAEATAQAVRHALSTHPARAQTAPGQKLRVHIIASHPSGDEDLACAEFIRDRILIQDAAEPAAVTRRILASDAAQKFLDPARPEYERRDLDYCAHLRPATFAMRALANPIAPMLIAEPLQEVRA